MTIQANFPAIKPSLMLDFANTKQLDSRITYTRASTATFYNGVTTSMAEQNLLLYSQAFNSWSNTALTVTADTTTAPDGTTTADTMTATGSVPYVYIGVDAITKVGTYTFSCYVKAGTNNFVALNLQGTANSWVTAVYNLSTGAVTQTGNGSSGLATITTTSITSVGSSWYRCVLTASSTSTVLIYPAVMFAASATGNTLSASYGETSGNTVGNTLFVWGAQIEARSSATAYTATTTQAITNYIPKLQSAASGVARFDNNPTTGESLGLLIEESRTNLMTYSSQLDNGVWAYVASSITADTVVAPDGTLTGDKLVENTASSTHSVYARPNITSGTTYALSFYVKPSGRNRVTIQQFNSTSPYAGATFDVSTGTVVVASGTGASGSIISVGNGWYRCVLIGVANETTSSYMQISLAQDSHASTGAETYTGNGFSGAFVWGAQLEAGAFATSYIPTVASQVTRAADAASMTGTNFSSWYNNAEWTLYTETTFTNTNSSVVISIDDGSFNNIARIGSYLNDLFTNVYSNSAFQFNQTPVNSLTRDVFYKIGFAAKPNSYAAIANTNTLITQNSGILFTGAPYQMTIGNFFNGDQFTGRIKKIAYYPVRVTNAQLAALTS